LSIASIRSHVQVYSLYCHRTRALRNPQSSNGSHQQFTRYCNLKNANQTKKSDNYSSLQTRVPKCARPLSGSLQAEIYALPHSKSRSVELSYSLSSFGFQPCNDNYPSHRTIIVLSSFGLLLRRHLSHYTEENQLPVIKTEAFKNANCTPVAFLQPLRPSRIEFLTRPSLTSLADLLRDEHVVLSTWRSFRSCISYRTWRWQNSRSRYSPAAAASTTNIFKVQGQLSQP